MTIKKLKYRSGILSIVSIPSLKNVVIFISAFALSVCN
jgi:hypothetical protein